MKRVFQTAMFSVILFSAFNCMKAQSILSVASKLETGIKTNLPQCDVTSIRVSRKKSDHHVPLELRR